uniref:Secreted protein n=1 Tax=Globodera rostochiensis TaxID=31243 RepID=A0A914I9Y9_GLORO
MPRMNAQLLVLCFFVLVHPSSGAGALLTPGCWFNTVLVRWMMEMIGQMYRHWKSETDRWNGMPVGDALLKCVPKEPFSKEECNAPMPPIENTNEA